MSGLSNLVSILAIVCLLLPARMLSQDTGGIHGGTPQPATGPAVPVLEIPSRKPQTSGGLANGIFEQLEAAPAEPPVDVVRLRLLHNEIRRWIHQASIPDDDSFDDWAFGGEDGQQRFRNQLDDLLKRKLDVINRVFQLTEPQRRKVKLAGLGDIKHLIAMVDDSRREFERASFDVRRLPELRRQLHLIDVRISSGPFEAGSMLAKTVRKMFAESQITTRPVRVAR